MSLRVVVVVVVVVAVFGREGGKGKGKGRGAPPCWCFLRSAVRFDWYRSHLCRRLCCCAAAVAKTSASELDVPSK